MDTRIRFRVVDHTYGPRIELCFRRDDGKFQTTALSWRSKPVDLKEDDLHFSFESAKAQWEKKLGK